MTVSEVRGKYLEFFSAKGGSASGGKSKGHVIVPSASLVPENDPTTLFTGSGMQPMLPYLLGEQHPSGRRIADSQKCFRSGDIEEVGDNRHTTFFEMLGNWSLGDYWKEEQLSWVFEFLTKELGIAKEKLWVSCFEGDEKFGLPKDDESAQIWRKIGMPSERICFYGSKKNWWSRAGVPESMPVGEPGGPDSEIFYDFGVERGLHEKSEWRSEKCHPNCDCGRFMEIGNSVFMEYRKTYRGFERLPQKNVDFGGGLERITAAVNNEQDILNILTGSVFEADVLSSIRAVTSPVANNLRALRIIADHFRAAIFLISDGVVPSNTERGYFLRRLVRRAISVIQNQDIGEKEVLSIVRVCAEFYRDAYPRIKEQQGKIVEIILAEARQFSKALKLGLKEFEKIAQNGSISGAEAFLLFSTYGLPIDMTTDLALERKIIVDKEGFEKEFDRHRNLSRVGSEKKFKGGLADTSEMSLKYHTATHLLHQALRDVLGKEVQQKGSNITPERLRFDFAFGRKMTDEEKKRVEDIVNSKIQAKLPMQKVIMPFVEAEKTGALHFFGEKYGDEVSIYFIGDSLDTAYSKEFCGGPHVTNTGVLGVFKIAKEEAVSAGVRRIKAVLS